MSVARITDTRQYLTFRLGEEVFALDVSHVREILEFTTITKVPRTPHYMRGVINLRGSVVPVFDMRLKFGLTPIDKTVNTCVIVVEATCEGGTTVIGALVDSVEEVFELTPEEIEPAPSMGIQLCSDFIAGMGKRDDRFMVILDIDKVFTSDELASEAGVEARDNPHTAGSE